MEMQGKLKGKAISIKKLFSVVRPSILSPRPHNQLMWWPKKGSDCQRGLLSRGKEPLPECPVRVGDWGPFAGSESSKSRDRQRSSLQEGLLV